MILQAGSIADVSQCLAQRFAAGEQATHFDLARLNRLIAHIPEDMTATVEAGLSLAAFQSLLAERGQWLPIDPPRPESTTIGALLAANLSGPRRLGYGTIRDHLIGLTVVLADGRVVHSGGRVVKNVAGYDLLKLFIGSRGTLGVIVEATFKLLPRPEAEAFVIRRFDNLGAVEETLIQARESEPIVLDLYGTASGSLALVMGFAGARADVDWQLSQATSLGFTGPATLDHNAAFWDSPGPIVTHSVAPARVSEALRELGGATIVARAGNGVIYYREGPSASRPQLLPLALFRRVKEIFDPRGIFPEMEPR